MVIHRKPYKRRMEEGWLLLSPFSTHLSSCFGKLYNLKKQHFSLLSLLTPFSLRPPKRYSSAWSLPLFFLTSPHLLTPGSPALASKAKIFAEERQRAPQCAVDSIHNAISWKSRAGERREEVRQKEQEKKGREGWGNIIVEPSEDAQTISHTSTLVKQGDTSSQNPEGAGSVNFYHLDIKQGWNWGRGGGRDKAADLALSRKPGTGGREHVYSSHFSKSCNNSNTEFWLFWDSARHEGNNGFKPLEAFTAQHLTERFIPVWSLQTCFLENTKLIVQLFFIECNTACSKNFEEVNPFLNRLTPLFYTF